MRSKEKMTEEIVLIRYYNVLFYLFFKTEIDDFKRQCRSEEHTSELQSPS